MSLFIVKKEELKKWGGRAAVAVFGEHRSEVWRAVARHLIFLRRVVGAMCCDITKGRHGKIGEIRHGKIGEITTCLFGPFVVSLYSKKQAPVFSLFPKKKRMIRCQRKEKAT